MNPLPFSDPRDGYLPGLARREAGSHDGVAERIDFRAASKLGVTTSRGNELISL